MRAGEVAERLTRWSIRSLAAAVVGRKLRVDLHGLEHLPPKGPTLVVARHVHHLYDAALLLAVIERPVHFLVALDWVGGRGQRAIMEAACRAARWPVLLRTSASNLRSVAGPYVRSDTRPYLRRALGEANDLLCSGRLLVIFPEGYPNVDPTFTPKSGLEDWLPFSPIFGRIAARAERSCGRPVPIVPVGLAYEPGDRWRVRLRFGPATTLGAAGGSVALTRTVETTVAMLSRSRHTSEPGPGWRPHRGEDARLSLRDHRGGGAVRSSGMLPGPDVVRSPRTLEFRGDPSAQLGGKQVDVRTAR
jgi:putative membrane protein